MTVNPSRDDYLSRPIVPYDKEFLEVFPRGVLPAKENFRRQYTAIWDGSGGKYSEG